jgi:enamine deaminase RidA (YjgF/YER057c/UK114 family)
MPRSAGSTPDAPAPAGPYSQCVRAGSLVICAGQGGFALDGSIADDVAAQTEQRCTSGTRVPAAR